MVGHLQSLLHLEQVEILEGLSRVSEGKPPGVADDQTGKVEATNPCGVFYHWREASITDKEFTRIETGMRLVWYEVCDIKLGNEAKVVCYRLTELSLCGVCEMQQLHVLEGDGEVDSMGV